MLTELIIRNFAVIDRLHVTFGSGFNVLTGETGAGKSIIIDAVGLLLGGRARPDLIRTGEDEAVVEAVFDLSDCPELRRQLGEAGFEEGDELMVRRIVARAGKNRVFLNGSLAKLGQLQEFVGRLVNIYGQHEHQGLQRPDAHLGLLDAYAGLEGELDHYRQCYREVNDFSKRLEHLEEAERERQQRLDLLRFQSREIAEAQLKPEEDDELEAERLLLQNSERLANATQGGYDNLYGTEGAVCERLDGIASELEGLAEVDDNLGQLAQIIRDAQYSLEDTAIQLRDYSGKLSFEPGRLDALEERLALLAKLKRKYASTLQGILEYKVRVDEEIEDLADVDATRDALLKKVAHAREEMQKWGEALSRQRQDAARRLKEGVEKELKDLAMPKACFEVGLSALAEAGSFGLERGEFYLAPNPGEDPKPLARIASGGELSRIMLALRRAAPAGNETSTLIFDEVDAGIGGKAATAVGEKLRGAAKGMQVLCITHLPQVAAFAERHYRVEKREEKGRTFTTLTPLEGEERVREMARMLGGAHVTERTLEHAREIIVQSALS